MSGDVFYYAGAALVLAALIISAIGIRNHEKFPPSRGVMAAAIGAFLLLVVGTTATAVVLAREEQDHRRHKEAEELAHAAEEVDGNVQSPTENESKPLSPVAAQEDVDVGTPPGRGAEELLDVTSPEDGSLVFEPDSLAARAGTITLTYANPSPVPHSIAIEDAGEVLDESDIISNGDEASITAELGPGEFIYFCTVPGHRESGMEGTLTVAGPGV